MKGFSIYFCFGPYAGFKLIRDGFVFRIILGWFAIGLMNRDIELFHKQLHEYILDLEKSNSRLVCDNLKHTIQGDPTLP